MILSFVYNYLREVMREEINTDQLTLLPPGFLLEPEPQKKISNAERLAKSKRVQFFEEAQVHPIPKNSKGRQVGDKRKQENDSLESPLKKIVL